MGAPDATLARGDVNGDSEVNREDINAVLDALEAAAAAPAAVSTIASLQRWIDRAKQLNRTDARFQKGIAVLQNLLTMLRETETVPKATALLANYPNPFNPETWIPYQLAKEADVTLRIYAIDGTLVRTLALGHQPMRVCIKTAVVQRIGMVEMLSVNLWQVACISIRSPQAISPPHASY